MKLPLLLTSLICTFGTLQAQQSSQSSQNDQSAQDKQSTSQSQSSSVQSDSQKQDSQVINEPSGAERPGSSSTDLNSSTPSGRAFSTNNPPQGRPFQEDPGLPPGQRKHNIKEGEQSGIPTDEPAGAQRPQASSSSSTSTNSSSSVTGSEVISSPKSGTASSSSASGELKPGDPGYAAGAQKQNTTQLQNAFAQFKTSTTVSTEQKTQLRQTLTSMVTTTKTVQPEFITRLSDDLSMSLGKVELTADSRTRLANAIAVILGAQPGAQTEVQQAFSDVQSILLTSPNTTPLARATVCDLHLIATELVPDLRLDLAK